MPKRTDIHIDPDHRLRPDRHRPGLRVRLLGHPGLPGAARGGLPGHPGQLQPGDDHDRPRLRRRAPTSSRSRSRSSPGSSSASGPTRCCRRSAARPALNLGHGAVRARASLGVPGRRDDRRQRRGHRHGRGPRAVQAGDGRDRPRRARSAASPTRWTRPMAVVERDRPAGHHPPGVHPRRAGHRHRRRRRRSSSASPPAGLDASPISEILIEKSIAGWKEFELEVMRDRADNCVIICSIENVDPMGVHTGDSITVAPAQTLTDVEYQPMRDAAFACIRRVGVETGGSQRAVRGRTRTTGEHGRHRDEPARVAVVGAGVEGDRLPDRQDRRQARRRLHARRDPQRHHRRDAGQLRADHRLRRHQDPAVGVREAARHRPACSARRCSRSARRWPSAARSPRACRRALRSLEQGRLGLNCDPAEAELDDVDRRRAAGAGRRRPRPTASSRSASCCAAACRSTRSTRRCRIDPWFLDQMLRDRRGARARSPAIGLDGDDPRGSGGGPSGSASPTPSSPTCGASTSRRCAPPRQAAGVRADVQDGRHLRRRVRRRDAVPLLDLRGRGRGRARRTGRGS